MEESFGLTWEDATTVVQSEEVITMENEIIPSQSEEFIGEEEYVENIQEEALVDDVGVVEEEVIQTEEVTLGTQQSDLMYLTDGNVLVMHPGTTTDAYTQEELMEVTEEVITDQWGEGCPEEIIIGSEEAVGTIDGQPPEDEDIPLPTDQDEYTAARPYPCDFCSRRFRKKANLMNHMVAHQTDRPHGCNLCGVRYMRKSDLMNHLKSHAFIPESEPIEDDEMSLDEQGFDKGRKKMKNFVKKKKKKSIKEEYDMFTIEGESPDEKLIGDMEQKIEYLTSSSQEEIRYPITDPKKPFVCQHCGVGFAREKALASHARIHGGDSPFECQKCGEMFWDISLMQEHARTKHGEIEDLDDDEDEDYSDSEDTKYGNFHCPTCGLFFHRQDNLKRHQRIHIKEEYVNEHDFAHICNVCGECFNEALDLLAHAEVHARGPEHRCMICGEVCVDEATLAAHVQNIHKNLPPFTCSMCGRTCKDNRTLLKHSWEHSKEKSFACTKCSKTFHNKARLKRHMISHRNKVVSCDVCGDDFPDGRSLMNHRHSHSSVSGRQFPCRECGKTFGSRSSQQIHIRIHTGERPYGCRFCWKAFADGGTLRKHERIHTGEKPYACAVCPRAFNQRVVLREHIRSHHSGPDPKYSHSTTPYCCAVCSDMFATSQDLILHLIHHCDMNTAMKRQPQVGPRKYKRRRKFKPHELEMMSSSQAEEPYMNDSMSHTLNNTTDSEEERESRKRSKRVYTRKASMSPKTSISETMSDIYNSNSGMDNVEPTVSLPKSPTSKMKLKKGKSDAVAVPSRPKMIHTQKTRVAVETGEDGRVRHRTRTLITRTQPAEIKSSTGERIRPRTKNVSYHVLNPEKFPLATFPSDDQTNEAVENLLKEAGEDMATNGNILSEEIIEQAPDIAAEQTVETESVPIPVGIVQVRTRRNSTRNARNIIGPERTRIVGSKVRLIKEGMIISKVKRNSESQIEPESILPDMQPAVYIKEEHHNANTDQSETSITEDEHGVTEPPLSEVMEPVVGASTNGNVHMIDIKQEITDPSALHELAELSMRHANSTTTNLYKCEMCDEVFSDRAQLLLHVPIHI